MEAADALVYKVVDKLLSNIQQDSRLVPGVKEEVRMLTSRLQSIQDVLDNADRRQYKELTVRLWLGRLKSVTYDIDDAIDEWSYTILRSRFTWKVWSSSLQLGFYFFPWFVSPHHIAVKFSNLNERLKGIANEIDWYHLQTYKYLFQQLRRNNEQIELSLAASVINLSEVKGRDADKNL